MFSVRSLTSAAKSAMRAIAPGVNRIASDLGREKRRVLLDERALRFGQDAYEILSAQRFELDANRKAPLQLRDQVRGFGDVKRAGGNEENVIRLDHAVLGVDGRAFDDGQDVALHAFAADIRPVAALAPRHLVDLVDEDDPRLLHAIDRGAGDGVHVDELLLFFLRERLQGLGYGKLALARPPLEKPRQHVLDVDVHFLDRRTGDDLERREALLAHVDLDLLVVEAAVAQLFAQLLTRALRLFADARRLFVVVRRRRQRRQEEIENALFSGLPCLLANLGDALLADHVDGKLGQVAHHRLDVSPDVADLGVLRRLDLDEGRLRELGEAARDLGLADAGRADHQDVLRARFPLPGPSAASAAAYGCAAQSRRRAWRAPGRQRTCRAPRQSGEG